MSHGVRGAPEPRPSKGVQGTLDFGYDPRRPSAGRRGEAHHATHAGPRAMAASVSCYRVVQVDVRAPFDKGRLVVRGHVT